MKKKEPETVYVGYTNRAPKKSWEVFTMICRARGKSYRKQLNELIDKFNEENKGELAEYVKELTNENFTR